MTAYEEKRASIVKAFEGYKPLPQPLAATSPSGKYRLVITTYETKPGSWAYTRGQVFCGSHEVADVMRNYSRFPYAWAEGHPNGHDYLLCGEDYQGQTVVELDTGRQVSTYPEAATKGFGFCWSSIHPSPDKKFLAVDGCFWACPYEVVIYDFRDPMNLPLPELERWDEAESFDEWQSQGAIQLARTVEVRKSDKKPIDDLEEAEWPPESEWEDMKIIKLWTPECLKEKTNEAR
jgi:hypothetical protein